jgi:hypothetical protein
MIPTDSLSAKTAAKSVRLSLSGNGRAVVSDRLNFKHHMNFSLG